MTAFRCTHRHLQSREFYQEMKRGLDATNTNPFGPIPVVIHRNCKNEWFTRRASEFDDGRFQKLD